jgi:hypothetical protein
MASGFSPSGLQKLGDFFSDSILVTCHFLLPYTGFFLDPIIFIEIYDRLEAVSGIFRLMRL